MKLANIELPQPAIEDFCRRWGIQRLELFGSVLRQDFTDTSDIDFLFTLKSDQQIGLLDLITMEQELAGIMGRNVDLITRRSIERSDNPIRKSTILESAQTVYDAGE